MEAAHRKTSISIDIRWKEVGQRPDRHERSKFHQQDILYNITHDDEVPHKRYYVISMRKELVHFANTTDKALRKLYLTWNTTLTNRSRPKFLS